VEFLGRVEEVGPFLRAADVATLASRWEGTPASVLEAMAAGVPVVATRAGETPGIVEDGVFGRLVPSGDPEALASALASLLRNRQERELWGARAAEAAKRYSFVGVVRRYEAIFRWAARRAPLSELATAIRQ
jgi:glycosyltransferase involved in cell wall biosynthesis